MWIDANAYNLTRPAIWLSASATLFLILSKVELEIDWVHSGNGNRDYLIKILPYRRRINIFESGGLLQAEQFVVLIAHECKSSCILDAGLSSVLTISATANWNLFLARPKVA
jgi:hypothetical protein